MSSHGIAHSLLRINALSLCSQAVQLGAVPALIALRLNASGYPISVLGVIAAAPWLAVLLLCARVPALLARFGNRSINAAALAASALAVAVIIFAGNLWLIFAANFCLGVGLILRWIACDGWIMALTPDAIRGRAIGIHETLMGCGIAAGPLLIALFGSRSAASLVACLGLLFVAAYALFSVNGAACATARAAPADRSLRLVSLMAAAAFTAGFIETSSISFLPVLSLHARWPAGTLALGTFTLGGALLQLPFGYLADTLGCRAAQLIGAALIAISAASLIVLGHAFMALLFSLFLLGGAAGGMNTLALVEAGSALPMNLTGAAAGRIALAYTLGSIIGPPTIGLLVARLGPVALPFAFACIAAAFCVARGFSKAQSSDVKTTLPTAVFDAGT